MKNLKLLLATLLSTGFITSAIAASPATATLPHISATELKLNNGQSGHKSYVALNGKVYDVSNVDEWKGGKHYKGMVAGTDLTPNIKNSPHGASIVDELKLKPIAVYP